MNSTPEPNISDRQTSRLFTRHAQASPYHSPHSVSRLLTMLLWGVAWQVLCAWTPKPFNPWRILVLRIFGARIYGRPFVYQSARIHYPPNLILHHRSCVGDRAVLYTQGVIELKERCIVAQEAYLCTGSHDFEDPNLPLITAPIVIGADAFVGARAFIMPGVTVAEGALVGSASVVTRDVPAWTVAVGNPARAGRPRKRFTLPEQPSAKGSF